MPERDDASGRFSDRAAALHDRPGDTPRRHDRGDAMNMDRQMVELTKQSLAASDAERERRAVRQLERNRLANICVRCPSGRLRPDWFCREMNRRIVGDIAQARNFCPLGYHGKPVPKTAANSAVVVSTKRENTWRRRWSHVRDGAIGLVLYHLLIVCRTPSDVFRRRQAQCFGDVGRAPCVHRRAGRLVDTCGKCGCAIGPGSLLQILLGRFARLWSPKLGMAYESCPIQKWPAVAGVKRCALVCAAQCFGWMKGCTRCGNGAQ